MSLVALATTDKVNAVDDAITALYAYLAANVENDLLTVGDLVFSAAPLDNPAVLPVKRLLCDGSAVSRNQFANLFAKIGTLYGVGDGSTTFKLPDYRNNFPIGAGSTYGLGAIGGEATHTLVTAEIPQHSHTLVLDRDTASGNVADPAGGLYGIGSNATAVTDGGTGGGGPHNNLPPFVACFVYIKT